MKHLITLAALAAPFAAAAACPEPAVMAKAAEGWTKGERLPALELESMEDATCAAASFEEVLIAAYGDPVGVKVGFTSAPAQEAFGVDAPVAGPLYQPMILEDGAEVSLAGTRSPLYEADLVVTVEDAEALMAATSRIEAAMALDEIRPFIELPDMALEEGVQPTGLLMAAYGVMPWRGVMGEGVRVKDLEDPLGALAAMTVDLKLDGESVSTGTGEMLLGHPLDVVLFLIESGGFELSNGSVISLGSLSPLTPAEPGVVSAEYMLADQPMSVSVTLTD
ncbi:hydratase [Paracoccaceae bacterium GXU_MW_L88]